MDKFVRVFYNALSVVVHISLITLIFAVPVLFIVKGNAPLDFTLHTVEVTAADASDEQLLSVSPTADGWYKIEYDMSVSASKLSPYGYTVARFALIGPKEMKKNGTYAVFLDEPIAFGTGGSDDFVIDCYIRASGEEEARQTAQTLSFGTRGTVRKFSFFDYAIPMYLPGFDVAELK